MTFAEAAVAYVRDGGCDRFLDPLIDRFGNKVLGSITPAAIRQAAIDLHPGCRPETLNRQVVSPARAVILYGHDQAWCGPIRVKGFTEERLKRLGHTFKPKRETQAVTWEWIDSFRAHASTPYLAAIALFMFTTGARIGSACRMTRHDFDLKRGIAVVPPTKGAGPLEVALVPELVAELRELKPRGGRIFGYQQRNSVYDPWRNTCKRAGIPYVPPHQAGRHSFATELVTRGDMDTKTAMEAGGWKSSRLFTETYVHGEDHHDEVRARMTRRAKR